MDMIDFLEENGFKGDSDGFIKSKRIPFGYDKIDILLKVRTSSFKYRFGVELSSPVFMVGAEIEKSIDRLNWTPAVINNIFEDLIKSSFDTIAEDVIQKVIPIQDRL